MTHNSYAMLTDAGKKYLADMVAGVQSFQTLYMSFGDDNTKPYGSGWYNTHNVTSFRECVGERMPCTLANITNDGMFTITGTCAMSRTVTIYQIGVFTAKTGGTLLFYKGTTSLAGAVNEGVQHTKTITAKFQSLPDDMGGDPCITADGLSQLVNLFIGESTDLPVYLSYGCNGVEAPESRVLGTIAKNGDYGITVTGTIAGTGDIHTVNEIWLSTSPTAPHFAWANIDGMSVHEGDSLTVTLSTSVAY